MRDQPPAHEPAAPGVAAHDGQDLLGRRDVVSRLEGEPVTVELEPLGKLSQVGYEAVSPAHLMPIMDP